MPFEILIILVLIGGVAVSAVALIHPAGPALLVLASTPFDPLMTNLFGMTGNLVTIVPIALVLLKVGPSRWFDTFLGTRVQRALTLFLAVATISYSIGYLNIGPAALFSYLQRIAGLLLVGVFAVGLRQERYVDLCMKALAVSMALFTLVSMLEFYVGLQIFPTVSEFGAGGPGSGQIACNFGFVDILVLERSRYATGESHGTRGTRTTL